MWDKTNGPIVRSSLIANSTSNTTCQIASGQTGIWFNNGVATWRKADGTDVALGGGRSAWAPVVASTTAALATCVYANGTLGVGATLTKSTNGALGAIDGVTLAAGDRLLVKNQSATEHNGVYVVTSAGGAGSKWVLTRADDCDQATDFTDGKVVAVGQGTANANSLWQFTTNSAITVGTTGVVFSSGLLAPNAVTGTALSAASMRLLAFAGSNGAGACTATGTKVGDTVIGVIDLAAGSVSAAASFESTITVADQIQQSSASDLSLLKYALLVVAKS